MRFKLHYLLRLALFWICFFLFFRISFIAYHFDKLPGGNFPETLAGLFVGLRLDVSMIAYFLIPSYLLWALQQMLKNRVIHNLNYSYNVILILCVSLLSIINIRMYEEWGTLLNQRAFIYLDHPQEILHFTASLSLIKIIFCWLLFSSIALYFYQNILYNFSYSSQKYTIRALLIILVPAFLFIGARGGTQQIPVNESSAYYSSFPIHNHIATNHIWYLIHSFLDVTSNENPYRFMNEKEAASRCKSLFTDSGNTNKILGQEKPNIILIVLESWTADIIASLGGEPGITPYFDTLCNSGLLFSETYSSGFRTDQGLTSILSGFPAQPNTSVITTPGKTEQLPMIPKQLIKKGYQSSFYYGGEIGFANMKTYLVQAGFRKIIDKSDFPAKQLNSKWGAHDEHVFDKQLKDLRQAREPFFSVLLTLSSHEPFEVPSNEKQPENEADQFRNAATYTDNCLKDYFASARKEKWFSNTLFILVADHGHRLPKNNNMDEPAHKRIPLLFYGSPLKNMFKNKRHERIMNQHDLASTLLAQLNISHTDFRWSKNILDSQSREFAYYSNENVLGWITPGQNIIYYFGSDETKVLTKTDTVAKDSLIIDAKAYLQTFYQEYLNY